MIRAGECADYCVFRQALYDAAASRVLAAGWLLPALVWRDRRPRATWRSALVLRTAGTGVCRHAQRPGPGQPYRSTNGAVGDRPTRVRPNVSMAGRPDPNRTDPGDGVCHVHRNAGQTWEELLGQGALSANATVGNCIPTGRRDRLLRCAILRVRNPKVAGDIWQKLTAAAERGALREVVLHDSILCRHACRLYRMTPESSTGVRARPAQQLIVFSRCRARGLCGTGQGLIATRTSDLCFYSRSLSSMTWRHRPVVAATETGLWTGAEDQWRSAGQRRAYGGVTYAIIIRRRRLCGHGQRLVLRSDDERDFLRR